MRGSYPSRMHHCNSALYVDMLKGFGKAEARKSYIRWESEIVLNTGQLRRRAWTVQRWSSSQLPRYHHVHDSGEGFQSQTEDRILKYNVRCQNKLCAQSVFRAYVCMYVFLCFLCWKFRESSWTLEMCRKQRQYCLLLIAGFGLPTTTTGPTTTTYLKIR